MNSVKLLAFFKDVNQISVPKFPTGSTYLTTNVQVCEYDQQTATRWLTKARTALAALLPLEHPVVRQFESIAKSGAVEDEHVFERLRSTFQATTEMLEGGHLVNLIAGIRAETEVEILVQAKALLVANHLVAATVLAGGALETHLHGLCTMHKLSWSGDGSIAKYDAAIAQARNSGTEIYSSTSSKQVLAWGGLRNDASHKPAAFSASEDTVMRMIDGIEEFIARTT